MVEKMSRLGKLYEEAYKAICGSHPKYYPWHFQWHFLKDTFKWQKQQTYKLYGRILDVGCGDKPYKIWLNSEKVDEYIGIDIIHQPSVDVVVQPHEVWPFEDGYFDCVVITQSLEHLENTDHTISEITRSLKVGGSLLLTVPFIYPVHGSPYDFRRYTIHGLHQMFSKNFEIKEIKSIGKVGSVLATLLLTNINNNMNMSFLLRLIKGLILPVWILFSFIVNILCQILNFLDFSDSHYCNSCLLAIRKNTHL